MATKAEIIHQIPGRIRMRIAEKRGDATYFSQLSEWLAGIETVENVKSNAATGSVVVEFFDSPQSLGERLRQHGIALEARPAALEGRQGRMPRRFDMERVNIVSGREIGPMFMLGSLLAVIGLAQAVRGQVLVPSITAFWYALEAFRQSGETR